MDVISLFPLEIFYYFTGVNSLLRFPRLLKVSFLLVPTFKLLPPFLKFGFSSQYTVFFEFNDRMEAVMKKAYIYRWR